MKQGFHSQFKFTFLTLSLVIALGFKTFDSLFSEKDEVNFVEINQTTERQPASIQPLAEKSHRTQPLNHEQIRQESLTISMNCQKNKKLISESGMVMLRGQYCLKNLSADAVKIINLRNGFEASVFLLENNKFNTDLIQLSSGLNEIQIQVTNASQIIYQENIQLEFKMPEQLQK